MLREPLTVPKPSKISLSKVTLLTQISEASKEKDKRNHASTMPSFFPFFLSTCRHSFNQAQYVQHKQVLTNLQTINRYSATGQNETNQRLTLPICTSNQILIHYSK